MGLQGGAGTGKTTALSVLREAAEKKVIRCAVLHPPPAPRSSLAKAGLRAKPSSCFCAGESRPPPLAAFFVLDESSLASTKHIYKLFARLEPEDKLLWSAMCASIRPLKQAVRLSSYNSTA